MRRKNLHVLENIADFCRSEKFLEGGLLDVQDVNNIVLRYSAVQNGDVQCSAVQHNRVIW